MPTLYWLVAPAFGAAAFAVAFLIAAVVCQEVGRILLRRRPTKGESALAGAVLLVVVSGLLFFALALSLPPGK